MNIKNIEIEVDVKMIDPTLNCILRLEFDRSLEIPISISGRLIGSDHRTLSLLNEHKIFTDNNFSLRLLTSEEKDNLRRKQEKNSLNVQLSAQLSSLALESIEKQREQTLDKSVNLRIELIIKTIHITRDPKNFEYHDFLDIKTKRLPIEQYKIEQSDWVNNYSQKLGIGKFILLELEIPKTKFPNTNWGKLLDQLKINIAEMEKSIQNCDWERTMLFARKFYEDVKIGDNKKGNKVFQEAFSKRMIELKHSQEGIQNLYDGIWKLFDYISKFIHDKDKEGKLLTVLPIPTREDAYLVYALAIGILNLFAKN